MPAPFDAYFELMDETLLSLMGEQLTYLPKGGDARTVTGAVEQDGLITESPAVMSSQDVLHVLVMRDQENADYGGIGAPGHGHAVKREGSDDLYSFTGVRREVSTTAWVLEFVKDEPVIRGGGWQRR